MEEYILSKFLTNDHREYVEVHFKKEMFQFPHSYCTMVNYYFLYALHISQGLVFMEAITLRDFTASISLCAITSLLGAVITATVQIVADEDWEYRRWPALSIQEMVAYSIVAGSMSGMCVSFNAWAMKKRGPVMVSIFNPLGTVISAIFSFLLGESISLGSGAGMCLMFSGLYLVLWAKRKESSIQSCPEMEDENELSYHDSHYDIEKPLLA